MSKFKDIAKKEIEIEKEETSPKKDLDKLELTRLRNKVRRYMKANYILPPNCQKCNQKHNPGLHASNIITYPKDSDHAVFLCRSCSVDYGEYPHNALVDFTPITLSRLSSPEKLWGFFESNYIALLTKLFRGYKPWEINQCESCDAEGVTLKVRPDFEVGLGEIICDACGHVRRVHIFKN